MTTAEKKIGAAANFVDERLGAASWVKKSLNKVFPDHWSFMLGEICMYSFIILLLSATSWARDRSSALTTRVSRRLEIA